MEDETFSLFYRIYNSFPSMETSKENKRAFDYLPFRSKISLDRSMISIFKRILYLRYIVLLNELHQKVNFFLIEIIFLTNRRSMNNEKSRAVAIGLRLESKL